MTFFEQPNNAQSALKTLRSFAAIDLALEIADFLIDEAVVLSVTASMLNAIVERRILQIEPAMMQLLFPSPASAWPETRDAVGAGLFFSEALTKYIESLIHVMSRLALVLPREADAWADRMHQFSIPNIAFWEALQAQARRACSSIRILLLVVGDLLIESDPSHASRLLEVDHLLKSVLRDGSPCVRSDGSIVSPLSESQRRERRVPINQRVELLCSSGYFNSLLRDLAPSGFGLSEAPALAVGTQVAVKLPTVRMLVGVVRWRKDDLLGVKSLDRMRIDDELLRTAWAGRVPHSGTNTSRDISQRLRLVAEHAV